MTDPTLTRIADALEKLVDAYTQAQRRDHYARTDWYATDEERQREEGLEDAPAPDPLDENDHRDRIDMDGLVVRRKGHERWAWPGFSGFSYKSAGWPLSIINATDGPLAFAPDAAPDAPRADLMASEAERVPEDAAESPWSECDCVQCREGAELLRESLACARHTLDNAAAELRDERGADHD